MGSSKGDAGLLQSGVKIARQLLGCRDGKTVRRPERTVNVKTRARGSGTLRLPRLRSRIPGTTTWASLGETQPHRPPGHGYATTANKCYAPAAPPLTGQPSPLRPLRPRLPAQARLDRIRADSRCRRCCQYGFLTSLVPRPLPLGELHQPPQHRRRRPLPCRERKGGAHQHRVPRARPWCAGASCDQHPRPGQRRSASCSMCVSMLPHYGPR
jgi:hypothetical protein